MNISLPERPSAEGLEAKWSEVWEKRGIYRFDPDSKKPIFSIDTPPPTVSGSLHIGHVLSYTHTDIVARYKRMLGHEVFYPIGWDDNGVPTERRVQNYFGVRCEPEVPYDPNFVLPSEPSKDQIPISRRNFIELCEELTSKDEQIFEELWRTIGLSVDWTKTYSTVGSRSQKISQTSFVRLIKQGELYSQESPTLWDVDFRTAVSQAELEDREVPSAYHRVRFVLKSGGSVEIETTRPELIPACVALVAHPDDERFSGLLDDRAYSPLFGVELPIVTHHLADPSKGTGIAMVCTFGDLTDVTWWKELSLPIRLIVGRDGRFLPSIPFGSDNWPTRDQKAAELAYQEIAQKAANGARRRILELLKDSGNLIGEPKPIVHPVKFFEKGDKPLEIVASRQWFIKTLDKKPRLIELGGHISWVPKFMQVRYDNWVEGLNSDWNISRQRFFGIPIPVWYPLDELAEPIFDKAIIPDESLLPLDPQSSAPPGYQESQRNQPHGFVADPDVMDTWATSSLTPQIAADWLEEPELFDRLFPMDLRPQGQDIIRTWLFYTLLRSELAHGVAPWKSAIISGFVLDPDRKKMSKSKGNVVTPLPLVKAHGADALRYWSSGGRPGVDTAAEEGQMKVGRRLGIKILNASRFVLGLIQQPLEQADKSTKVSLKPIDVALLARLSQTVREATAALEDYDHTKGIEVAEKFFWEFCDDYLEFVKLRGYGEISSDGSMRIDYGAAVSARVTLLTGISVSLRLLAPYLPFSTEEAWSWWNEESVHQTSWPKEGDPSILAASFAKELFGVDLAPLDESSDQALLELASSLMSQLRKTKTEAKVSVKTPIDSVEIGVDKKRLASLRLIADDLRRALVIEGELAEIELAEGSEPWAKARVKVTDPAG